MASSFQWSENETLFGRYIDENCNDIEGFVFHLWAQLIYPGKTAISGSPLTFGGEIRASLASSRRCSCTVATPRRRPTPSRSSSSP